MTIFWLAEIKEHQWQVGGKASAIAKLLNEGFSVPNGFVITDIDENNQIYSYASKNSKSSSILALQKLSVENKLLVEQAIKKLCSQDDLLAIRSSAVGEDGEHYSFAGQFQSYLNIPKKNVEEKIFQVYYSHKNKTLNSYQAHFAGRSPSMAVLVQPMVKAEISGVAFSRDPLSGQRHVVINAVHGLGDRLMAGAVTGETYRVNRFNQIIEQPTKQNLLTTAQILEINALAHQIEQLFETPQDIEWAIANHQIYILQSRPITTLHNLPEIDGIFQLWDNSNIVESYSGITTPLTFSFAHKAYTEVYQQFCKIMGVSKQKIVQHQTVFQNMIGFIQGRIYYNLLNWYRVLAMLPAMQLNARFMEQMMGVKEELPTEFIEEIQVLSKPNNWHERLTSYNVFFSLIFNFFTLDQRIEKYHTRIEQVINLQNSETLPSDMQRWSSSELVSYYRSLESQLLGHWDAPLVNDFFAMIFYGLLRRCTEKWCADKTASLHHALIIGEGNVISTEPLTLMREMAKSLTQNDLNLFSKGDFCDIQQWLQVHPLFKQQYDHYLEKFGDRCLSELKLESPTLRDQPLLLFRAIAQLAQTTEQTNQNQTDLRAQAETKAFQQLKHHFIRKILFRWILKQARRLVQNRENLRFERTRIFGLARRIFLQLGRYLFQIKKLNKPEDIFYLEVEEIMGYVNGTSTCQNLQGLVNLRRGEAQKYQQLKPDNRFSTNGIPYHGNTLQSIHKIHQQSIKDLAIVYQGKSCAVSQARGEVRVVRNPQQFLELDAKNTKSRYILVAESTDPGWVLLFPYAAGLLVERGSVLSHVAIVCRELGLPMITDLSGITQTLRDGDWVEMDGSTGKVYKLETGAIADSNA